MYKAGDILSDSILLTICKSLFSSFLKFIYCSCFAIVQRSVTHVVLVVLFLLMYPSIAFGQSSAPQSEQKIDSPYVASYTTSPAVLEPLLPARRRPVPQGDFQTLTLPLKHAGNLILVEAKAGELEGNFILDFGAPYLVLNRTYFRDYEQVRGAVAADVTGANAAVYQTSLSRLQIRDLYFENLDADVADLGEIENRRGTRILGLLGVELFRELELTLDVLNEVLYIHRVDEEGNRVPGARDEQRKPAFTEPFSLQDNTIVVQVTIAAKPLRFALDSGAEVNVLDYGINRKVLRELQLEQRVVLHGAAGGEAEVLAGKLSEYTIAGRKFGGGKTIVANLAAMGKSQSAGGLDGMLGYTFFSQGIVNINFVRREFSWFPFFEENPAAGESTSP